MNAALLKLMADDFHNFSTVRRMFYREKRLRLYKGTAREQSSGRDRRIE